jgi:(R,R)-butanediol dehydrogenase/meso-butanediol dehydrogenase/diacetyl reductase
MKAALWYDQKDIRIEEIPEPTIKPGKVKIKVKWCGICGTDLHEYLAGPIFIPRDVPHPITKEKAPVVLGHEYSGEVVEVGEGVENLKIGDRVCVEPIYSCGKCPACKSGRYNLCPDLGFHGLAGGGGGFSEITMFDAKMVHKLPDTMSFEQGALVEPTAVALHAVRQSKMKAGDKVAIFGAGPIGLLTILAAKSAGASEIYVVEVSEERKKIAKEIGATAVFDPREVDAVHEIKHLTNGGVDVAFEVAGVEAVLTNAIDSTIFGGQVVIVSVWERKAAIAPNSLVIPEREIKGIIAYRDIFPAVIRLIANGQLPAEKLITKKIKLDNLVTEGFEALIQHKDQVKILVQPN